MFENVHPVTLGYGLSFASVFFWPSYLTGVPGAQCRELVSDWLILVVSLFMCTIAHTFYMFWIVYWVTQQRRGGETKDPDAPIMSLGSAIASGGTVRGWTVYFSFRVAVHLLTFAVLTMTERGCSLGYVHKLGATLVVDSAYTLLVFFGSWSADKLVEGGEKIEKHVSDEMGPRDLKE